MKKSWTSAINGLLGREDYWHPRVLPRDDPGAGRALYPFDFRSKADYEGPFDSSGVLLVDFGSRGTVPFAIDIAQFCLALMEKGVNAPLSPWDVAKLNAQLAFLASAVEQGPGGLIRQRGWTRGDVAWQSALTQGLVISVFVRSVLLGHTGNERIDVALRAEEAFYRPLHNGGVVGVGPCGGPFPEETPAATHVLNGGIFALWGLEDLQAIRPRDQRRDLIRSILEEMEHAMPSFDCMGGWSLYDLDKRCVPNAASWFYHNVHIQQLRVLGARHGDPWWRWHLRWAHAATRTRACAAHSIKLIHRLMLRSEPVFKLELGH